MKAIKLFALLMAFGFIGCTHIIDYKDFKPIYSVVNSSSETINMIYTLQPSAAEKGYHVTDTIAINAHDTIDLAFLGYYADKQCKPSSIFQKMEFQSKSGATIKEMNSINDEDWLSVEVFWGEYAKYAAWGWLYEFKNN